MAAADDVLKAHEDRRSLRQPYEGKWKEIARLIAPEDYDLDVASNAANDPDDNEIFDATAVYANDDFAAGLFSQATNPVNRWLELTIGDKDLAKWGPAKDWLYSSASYLFASMSPAVSNFYWQAPAWFGGVGAFGIGTLAQEERVGEGISDRVIPLGSTYLDLDADGNLSAFDNRMALRGDKFKWFVKSIGGTAPDNISDSRTYMLIHSCWKNREARAGRPGFRNAPWQAAYVCEEVKDFRIDGGYRELPYHPIFWSRKGSRLYPRGPGHAARADVNMLNEMERTHIVAAQFGAEPPLLLRDESVLSAADIVPNALLYGTMTDKGEMTASFLERRTAPQLLVAQSQQRRDAIRTAFRFGLMQMLANRPQMTATEFLGFQQQQLELMAPNLISIQIGLSAFIARRFGILMRAGQLPPPPKELANHALGIEYVSPLAKAQKTSEGRSIIQLQQSIEQMAVTDPSVRDWFDGDVAGPKLGDAFTNIPGLIRSPDAVAALRKQRAEAQARQAQIDQAAQMADTAATVSHAMQAKTLADGRSRPQ